MNNELKGIGGIARQDAIMKRISLSEGAISNVEKELGISGKTTFKAKVRMGTSDDLPKILKVYEDSIGITSIDPYHLNDDYGVTLSSNGKFSVENTYIQLTKESTLGSAVVLEAQCSNSNTILIRTNLSKTQEGSSIIELSPAAIAGWTVAFIEISVYN